MVRTILLAAVAVALAFGEAGLVGQLTHPPGDARRQELTWAADQSLGGNLDSISNQLVAVETSMDALAGDAKDALVAVGSGDATGLQAALARGAQRAASIDGTVAQLRATLDGLPGSKPADATVYSNAMLARRVGIQTALAAVGTLSGEWSRVTARSSDASALTVAIRSHNSTLASAANAGVKAQYPEAIQLCNQALGILQQISRLRSEAVQSDQATVLDDWIGRHVAYDKALLALYEALRASGGVRNNDVDAAYRAQAIALAQLPADNREVIVIIAQVAEGGLNDAVLAIEYARGEIDAAVSAIESPAPS
ncbi:MAG TPA: hypothetical protein VET90_05310 [Candidatus Binatus sp.]|nr:hypothetical protein [Candidatus Binatus sp.]